MNRKSKEKGAFSKASKIAVCFVSAILGTSALQGANLWSNGAVNFASGGDNRCDGGPNVCGNTGNAFWTVFDNFNVPASSKGWLVTGIDFSDFFLNAPTSDYKSTTWSIWNGDPLSGGKLVATGSAAIGTGASLSNLSGTCGAGSNCLEFINITFSTPVSLAAGSTYFLGTTNTLQPSNGGATVRAFAAGGNTAPNGQANPLQHWEQSNGSTSGVPGSTWTAGSNNFNFPGDLGLTETATAFDIQGIEAPEPGTILLLSMGLAGVFYFRRRRTT